MSLRAILGFREKVFQDDLRVKSLSSSKNMDKTFIQFSGKKLVFIYKFISQGKTFESMLSEQDNLVNTQL